MLIPPPPQLTRLIVLTLAIVAGYGAAQALPGPLFTFATYLGAVSGHVANLA